MFSIGEFSKITGLSVKTVRFYHSKELLTPTCVDEDSGYRYFDHAAVEKARVIAQLRAMEFSLGEIKEILDQHDDESEILDYLERQKRAIAARLRQQQNILQSLEQMIASQKEYAMTVQSSGFEVEEKSVDTILIAGHRMQGRYDEVGAGFGKVGKAMGRHICGKAMTLYYDAEYKESDADYEACMPVRKGASTDEVSVRELVGGKCVSLIHRGPWAELGRSYEKLLAYVKEHKYEVQLPTREVYLKGPGMIFKGNPQNYLTEIQMMLKQG